MLCTLTKPFVAALVVVSLLPISLSATPHDSSALGLNPTSDRTADLRISTPDALGLGTAKGTGRVSSSPDLERVRSGRFFAWDFGFRRHFERYHGLHSHEVQPDDTSGHKMCTKRSISLGFSLVGVSGRKPSAFLTFKSGGFSKYSEGSNYC